MQSPWPLAVLLVLGGDLRAVEKPAAKLAAEGIELDHRTIRLTLPLGDGFFPLDIGVTCPRRCPRRLHALLAELRRTPTRPVPVALVPLDAAFADERAARSVDERDVGGPSADGALEVLGSLLGAVTR